MRQNTLVLLSVLTLFMLFAHVSIAQDGGNTSEGNDTPVEPPAPPLPPPPEPPIYDIDLADFFPKQITMGDSQLNLYVENTGNQPLKNIVAIIIGEGISTYEVLPVEELQPGQKSYIIARISAKESGSIGLTIKILDDSFERKLYVRNPAAEEQALEQQREEERRRTRLVAAGALLANLTAEYDAVEERYYAKKNQGFDLSSIDLKDAKAYLRDAQASYAKSDVEQTEASLVLLQSELADLSSLLEHSQKPKRSFGGWIKDNSTFVITVGYILGIIISLFTIIELVKKNRAALDEKLKKPELPTHTPHIQPKPAVAPHPAPVVHSQAQLHHLPPQKTSSTSSRKTAKRPPQKRAAVPTMRKIRGRAKSPSRPKAHHAAVRRHARAPSSSAASAAKKYKLNKAKPTTHYAVQPADDEL